MNIKTAQNFKNKKTKFFKKSQKNSLNKSEIDFFV